MKNTQNIKNNFKMGTEKDKNDPSIQNKDIHEIERLLKKMTNIYNEKKSNNSPKKNLNVSTLNSLIGEYLDTYVIIGYDINDNYVQLSNLTTTGEIDKIQTAIHRLLRYGIGINTDITDYDNGEDFEDFED